ncbi:mre11 DNA-binding presumed domain-containing protein [Ditylenchus destructor]|nr:mre11 DNA-binding presumed domain-containing protein [Ditylenchus destructor]
MDQIKFLIASDIHAGYGESKKHIHNDSFESFREVLKAGVENEVDFVLLGGDLFHENNPSRETRLKVIRALRRYCMRENETALEFVSDPTVNFQHSDFPTVNYKDANYKIGMPVFSIHGNHDDLSGKGLTALDDLHETGLINFFGKFNDVDKIEVAPILLKKGQTKIAIYGISSQRDDRLCRAFMKECVKFSRPDDAETWFSILVIHQNRPRRSNMRTTGAFLPLPFIPAFFDLVIWGHEHESLIEPQYFTIGTNENGADNGFFIIQPGSTVATSLCKEEAVQKHCAIIKVQDRRFKSIPIPLQTTRQVIIDELQLDDSVLLRKIPRSTVRQKDMEDENLIGEKINEMLRHAAETRGPKQPVPPLLRLKVEYSGKWLNIPPINARRFGARYADKVANPYDMIVVRTHREEKEGGAQDPLNVVLGEAADNFQNVDEMVEKYFVDCSFEDKLTVLTEVAMSRSLKEYSNADGTYTVADRLLTESIKSQISTFAEKVKTAFANMQIDNDDEHVLVKKVEKSLIEMKKQKCGMNLTDITNGTSGARRDSSMEVDLLSGSE